MLKSIYLPNSKNRPIFFPHLKGAKTFTFKIGINCIIGPNASGKTVLLNTLRWKTQSNATYREPVNIPTYVNCEYRYRATFSHPFNDKEEQTIFWYEPQRYSKFNRDNIQDVFGKSVEQALSLSMYRRSEAECNSMYFTEWFNQHKDSIATGHKIICVDEPENSNDPLTIEALMYAFQNWCEYNPDLQILLTTHSPIVIAYANNVVETQAGWQNTLKELYLKVLTKSE